MPCYTVNLVSVELKATNEKFIMEVLKNMGLNPHNNKNKIIYTDIGTFNLENGTAVIQDRYYYQKKLNEFKVKYSERIIKEAANKNKWVLKRKENSKNKFVANKW